MRYANSAAAHTHDPLRLGETADAGAVTEQAVAGGRSRSLWEFVRVECAFGAVVHARDPRQDDSSAIHQFITQANKILTRKRTDSASRQQRTRTCVMGAEVTKKYVTVVSTHSSLNPVRQSIAQSGRAGVIAYRSVKGNPCQAGTGARRTVVDSGYRNSGGDRAW